jgi:hypothetical protein
MTAQSRGRRDAEDEVEAIGAAPVDDLRAAIMAVGAQQDLRRRPAGPDRANEPAQEGADFGALRTFGGTQHRRDEPPLAIEDDDRLEPVFVVVGMNKRRCWPPCTASNVSSMSSTIRRGTCRKDAQ